MEPPPPRPINPPHNSQHPPSTQQVHSYSGGRNPHPTHPGSQLPFSQFANIPQFLQRALAPFENPSPPRPRPPIFYYVFTLIYLQNGFTRKFRHYLPCTHNTLYLGINDIQKRHVYAAGCHCLVCPFCEEIQITHFHLNLFQCPNNATCPKVRKVVSTLVNAKIEHDCATHQNGMPHPNDLNQYPNLPYPITTPFQFTYHTTVTQDPTLLADAIFGPVVHQVNQALLPTYSPVVHENPYPQYPYSGPQTTQPPAYPASPPPPAVNADRLLEDPSNKFRQLKQNLLSLERLDRNPVTVTSDPTAAPPNSPATISVEETGENRDEVLAQRYERTRHSTGGIPPRGNAAPPSSHPERNERVSL